MKDKVQIISDLYKFKKYAEEQLGLYVYSVALKGSQNYNLDDEESDVDANLVFIPTPSQLRKNEKFKIELPFGECTCHNIYAFAEIVAKGNPQWSETIATKYKIGNNLEIFKKYSTNPSAIKGMVMEKVNAFDKLYPSRKHIVEKFGYDGKQLHHIIRLYHLLKYNKTIHEYYGKKRKRMIDIKRHKYPNNKEDARTLMNKYLEKITNIYVKRKQTYFQKPVDYDLIDEIVLQYYKEL